jgi:hypothetical protein
MAVEMDVVATLLRLAALHGGFAALRGQLAHAEEMWNRYEKFQGGAAYGEGRRPLPTVGEAHGTQADG